MRKSYLTRYIMKICFLLQRQFAHIGHNLAKLIKEQDGRVKFCGYVHLRSSYDFLCTQKEISYGTLLLDEEVHSRFKNEPLDLSYLENVRKKLGVPTLWKYLVVDRLLMHNQLVREYPHDSCQYKHEELMRIIQVHAKAIEHMFDIEKPDYLVSSVLGSVGSLLLYDLAVARGIKTLVILPACTENRYVLSERYDYFLDIEKRAQEFRNRLDSNNQFINRADVFLKTFREKPTSYHKDIRGGKLSDPRKRAFALLLPHRMFVSIAWWFKVLYLFPEYFKHRDYSYAINPWYYTVDHIRRKVRTLIGFEDLYDEMDPNEEFVFYPLHLEPEIAILLHAPFYTNQANLIRKIAESLPINYKLYVKEHHLMVEYRPRSFYKELKKMPNVKLIRPTVLGLDIIKQAKLVATITSTAAWEAVLLKKPAISFGHQFYNVLPMVEMCHDIEKLPELVDKQLHRFSHDEDVLRAYLAALFEYSVPVELHYLWEEEFDREKQKEDLRPLANFLLKRIGIKK